MEPENPNYFQDMKNLVTDYVAARVKLLKLELYEKSAKVLASLVTTVIVSILVVLLVLFLSIALGFYLGQLFNNYGTGFLAVAGIYFVLMLPFLFSGKGSAERWIVNRLLDRLMDEEEPKP